MSRLTSVDDARARARRRLPRIFFDYIDGGALSERTLAANQADFAGWTLRQKVLAVAPKRDLSTEFLGRRQALPFMLGPIGFLGLFTGDGERLAARAAAAADIPLCLSTFSIASLAQLRAVSDGPLHFQLYPLSDRALTQDLLQAAQAAGAGALYITVDTTVTGRRERDLKNGFRDLGRLTLSLLARLACHPAWCLSLLRAGRPQVAVLDGHPAFGRGIMAQAAQLSQRIDASLSWDDIARFRSLWSGRLVIKGVLSAEDAVLAFAAGADAVVVSNHGGRQLDGAASTISVLPEIVAAVGDQGEVLIDGGFRRGSDIVTALALGAQGVLLGRAYVFGLAAAGQAGVARIIAILAEEIDITLALMGVASIDELKQVGPALLRPAGPAPDPVTMLSEPTVSGR